MIRRDTDILRLDLRAPQTAPDTTLSLADVESVRLVLRGGSPIDWHRLNFESMDDVDDLLRSNLLDPEDPRDVARLEYLHREAVRYLRRNFAFRFPPEVERPADVRHLLLYASESGRMNRVQILSCVVLKTMHTINHLQARELLHKTPVSEAELAEVVEREVLERAQVLVDEGLPIVRFYGSRKSPDSMVSKLLSKSSARATDILDKLRFRIVVENHDDIVPVMAYLLRYVFPWNHVTAGESSNNLVHFRRYLDDRAELHPHRDALQVDIGVEDTDRMQLDNEFSGSTYRMINFIIDVPVRLDHLLHRAGDPYVLQHGSIVYVHSEFQVVDQETAWLNERGDNSHARYKLRQAERVAERLMWGKLGEGRRNGGSSALARKPRAVSALERAFAPEEGSDPGLRAPREPRPPSPCLPPPLGPEAGGGVS